jgi:hypothetical protein
MYGEHVSVTLCGLDNTKYVVYAFVDAAFDESEEDEELEPQQFVIDPIISNSFYVGDANCPIWDPREYYLRALMIWTSRICEEWQYLVHKVQRSVKKKVYLYFSPLSWSEI